MKTPDEIQLMARSGAILAEVHEVLREAVAPGVRTAELDALAYDEIRARGRAVVPRGTTGSRRRCAPRSARASSTRSRRGAG
jgi:methionyl aminopeptidase